MHSNCNAVSAKCLFGLQIAVAACTLAAIMSLQQPVSIVNIIAKSEVCPLYPSTLRGYRPRQPSKSWQELEKELEWVSPGGCWQPRECEPRQKVLVAIAFRDRDAHLPKLLQQLHPILRAQSLHYCIVVVSQNWDGRPFNRGILFNIGFDFFVNKAKHSVKSEDIEKRQNMSQESNYEQEKRLNESENINKNGTNLSKKMAPNSNFSEAINEEDEDFALPGSFQPDCFVSHDVDLVPLNDFNIYNCTIGMPKHLGVAFSTFNFTLPYGGFFGGVNSLSVKDFRKLNGYGNLFWGWGGEDDDFWNRVQNANLTVYRESNETGSYKMLSHQKAVRNAFRSKRVLQGKYFYKTDGLNSLKYEVIATERRRLYTNVTVKPIVVKPSNMVLVKPRSWMWSRLKSLLHF